MSYVKKERKNLYTVYRLYSSCSAAIVIEILRFQYCFINVASMHLFIFLFRLCKIVKCKSFMFSYFVFCFGQWIGSVLLPECKLFFFPSVCWCTRGLKAVYFICMSLNNLFHFVYIYDVYCVYIFFLFLLIHILKKKRRKKKNSIWKIKNYHFL